MEYSISSSKNDQKLIKTMREQDDRLFSANRIGAKGYLLKNLPVSKLLDSLRAMQYGEAPIFPQMTSRILEEFSQLKKYSRNSESVLSLLTTREIGVFRALAARASNQEIAERLFISENIVKNHVHKIPDKLQLNSRREVISFATRNRIEDLPLNEL